MSPTQAPGLELSAGSAVGPLAELYFEREPLEVLKELLHMPDDESSLRLALALDPSDAQAYFNLGRILARDAVRRSEAETAFLRAIQLEPSNPHFIYRLALLLHEHLNRPVEAETAYHRAVNLAPQDPYFYGGLIGLLVQQSRQSDALFLAGKMRALLIGKGNWYGLATLEAILGNTEAAIANLDKAARSQGFNAAWAKIDPDLASIRDDPRFNAIVLAE